MSSPSLRVSAAALGAALALSVAACSGGDDGSDGPITVGNSGASGQTSAGG